MEIEHDWNLHHENDKIKELEAKLQEEERRSNMFFVASLALEAKLAHVERMHKEACTQLGISIAKEAKLEAKLQVAVEALKVVGWHCSDDGSHDPDEMYDVIEKALLEIKAK